MPASWLAKYGYSNNKPTPTPNVGTSTNQPSWLNKYQIPAPRSTQPSQPTQPSNGEYTIIGGKSYPTASIVKAPPKPTNIFESAKSVFENIRNAVNNKLSEKIGLKKDEGLGAPIGRALQKVPNLDLGTKGQKTFKATDTETKIVNFLSNFPSAIAQSWGQSLETLSTKEGKKKLKEDTKNLPKTMSEVKTHIENREWQKAFDSALSNSALTVGLDVADFIPISLVAKMGFKGVTSGLRKTAQTVVKEGIEEAEKKVIKEVAQPKAVKVVELIKPKVETPITKGLEGRGGIPKTLEPLAQEARKYKSAEEFKAGILNTIKKYWGQGKFDIRKDKIFGKQLDNIERELGAGNLRGILHEISEIQAFKQKGIDPFNLEKHGYGGISVALSKNPNIHQLATRIEKSIPMDLFSKGKSGAEALRKFYTQATKGLEGGGELKNVISEVNKQTGSRLRVIEAPAKYEGEFRIRGTDAQGRHLAYRGTPDFLITQMKSKLGGLEEGGIKVKPKIESIKPIGEGEIKVSKLGLRVEQTAIEKKLIQELGDLPDYKQMNMKEQAKMAADLIKIDEDRAVRIALGQEEPPKGLLAQSVFKAMEGSITTPEMARKLATSPLVSEASALGQKIKALDVGISDSPVKAMQDVISARKQALEGRYGTIDKATERITKDIQSKVKIPSKYDWNTFIESIKC